MDICKFEPPGAMALQTAAQTEDKPRPPLVPSEKNNAIPATRKPRDLASRYKDGISSTPVSRPGTPTTPRRSPSPNASQTSPAPGMSLPKRALSVERRRPVIPSLRISASSFPSKSSTPSSPSRPSTPPSPSRPSTPSSPSRPSTPSSTSSRSTTPVRDAVKGINSTTRRLLSHKTLGGLWPSMRSLSPSFQSESVAVSVSKSEKVVMNSSPDKTIKSPANILPERRRTLRGKKTVEQSENSKPPENLNARVIEQHWWPSMLGGRLSANVSSRSVDLSDKVSRSASLMVASRGVSPEKTNSSSDSVTRAPQLSLSEVAEQIIIGGGRVEQDMKSAVHSSQPSETPLSATRLGRPQTSPIPGFRRPSSPNKVLSTSSSTSRGMLSPSRTRPLTPISVSSDVTSRAGGTSSVLNYIFDVLKGKKNMNHKNMNHIEDAHQLRLLYNANLQWQFVNAQADKTLSVQRMRTENVLYSTWNSISKLHDSVIMRRIDVQHLQQEIKLVMILREQMAYLEHFVALEREYCSSLSGAVKALNASTLRLPVTGARADVVDVKNAVSSAVNVMQAMGSSICYLLSKVEGTKPLVSELAAIAAKEKFMLDECGELLASISAMQVRESSLRTHIIQLRQDAGELD